MKHNLNTQVGVLVLSDVHLGHPRNPASKIIKKLRQQLSPENLHDVDLLIIAGDLFDRLLLLSADCLPDILLFLADLLKGCQETQTILRILEGTDSHDHHQLKAFLNLDQCIERYPDFKYHDQITVEYIEALNLHVLWVPDSLDHDTQVIFRTVQAKLAEQGLTQVDLTIMHGCFQYQIPYREAATPMHRESDYLGITRDYVMIGHHHTFSTYDRIIAQGSFDRLAHDQEEPKGYVKLYLDRVNQTRRYVFMENQDAMLFKTVKLQATGIKSAVLELQAYGWTSDAHVRIQVPKHHPLLGQARTLKLSFPGWTIDIVTEKTDQEKKDQLAALTADETPALMISASNIERLIQDRLVAREVDTPRVHQALECLREFI